MHLVRLRSLALSNTFMFQNNPNLFALQLHVLEPDDEIRVIFKELALRPAWWKLSTKILPPMVRFNTSANIMAARLNTLLVTVVPSCTL
jgi:hypothetical protein